MDLRHGKRIYFLSISLGLLLVLASPQLSQTDTLLDPYLSGMGLTTTPVGHEFSESFCAPVEQGLLLSRSGCPALWDEFDPLIMPWDIITEFNGKKVQDEADLTLFESVEELKLEVFRRGEFVKVTLPVLTSESTDEFASSFPRDVQHAVYYMSGEGVWEEDHVLLESGRGIISGKLMISRKPVEGVAVSLFLAGKKRTQPALTDSDGRFQVQVPPGKYFYIGYTLSGPSAPNLGMIPVDQNLMPNKPVRVAAPRSDSDDLSEKFSGLAAEYGAEKAAEMIADEFEIEFRDPGRAKYPITINTGESVSVPDIVYAEPVKIVAPLPQSQVSLDKLTFAWVPYEGAGSYFVKITHITKKGTRTTYRPICEKTTQENSLGESDLDCEGYRYIGDDKIGDLVPGELYGLRVYAYDKTGKLLSASSQHRSVEFFVK